MVFLTSTLPKKNSKDFFPSKSDDLINQIDISTNTNTLLHKSIKKLGKTILDSIYSNLIYN